MRTEGMVYLYFENDEKPTTGKFYSSVKERRVIIDTWKRLYAGAFNKCAIQISPRVYIEKQVKDVVVKKEVVEEKLKIPTVRPKSEYTNIKTYQYK